MLAIQGHQPKYNKRSVPNVLPCRIHHNGPAKITKRFWSPKNEWDGSKTAYFRGRKLRGRAVKLPQGYIGIAANSSERVLPVDNTRTKPSSAFDDEIVELSDDDEEEPEPVKVLDAVATFDEIMVWAHDQLPAADDPFVKGIEEWMAFAEAIHLPLSTTDDAARKEVVS